MLQATEAIKLILGQGDPLVGRLLTYDCLKMKFRELKLRKDKDCPVCGEAPTIDGYIDYEVAEEREVKGYRWRSEAGRGKRFGGGLQAPRRLPLKSRARLPASPTSCGSAVHGSIFRFDGQVTTRRRRRWQA